MDLKTTNDALDRGDVEGALRSLIEAWRDTRAVELETVISALSAWADSGLEPLPETDFESAWTDIARAGRAVDLPRLLAHLASPPLGHMARRMDAIAAFSPDPRLGPVFLAYIENPPTTSSSNFGVWTRMFKMLPDCVDTRGADELKAAAATPGGSSGFWTKRMKWCQAALKKVSDPAPLPADATDAVAALQTRIASLAEAGPPVVPALEAVRPPELVPVETLKGAVDALEDGDLETALDQLVSFWGRFRDGAVSDAIEALDALVEPDPIRGRKVKDRDADWEARAHAPAPRDVQALLDYAPSGQTGTRELRLEAMLHWRPDPRVYRFARSQVADYHVGSRTRFWSAVMDLMVRHADPREAESWAALQERFGAPSALHRHSEIRRQVRRVTPHYAAAEREMLPTPQWEQENLARIQAWIAERASDASRRAESDRAEESALVDAILADPESDEPRLVYADWLSERGDPRGEFILLDVQLAQGKRVRGKRDKAFKRNQSALLGPLEASLASYGMTWERGMLVGANADARNHASLSAPEYAAMCTDLRWAFLRDLKTHEGLGDLLSKAPLRDIRVLTWVNPEALQGLARRTEPLPLERLVLGAVAPTPEILEAFEALGSRLPALHTLDVDFWERDGGRLAPPEAFFRAEVVRNVAELHVRSEPNEPRNALGIWLARSVSAGSEVPVLRLHSHNLEQRATRREDGRYDVVLTMKNYRWQNRLEGVLAYLPTLTDDPHIATIEPVFENTKEDCEAQLRAALTG